MVLCIGFGSMPLQPIPPSPTPEDVAAQALAAMSEQRLDDFAALMHPEALDDFRSMLLPVAEAAHRKGQSEQLLTLFHGVETMEGLRNLDSKSFFAAFLTGVSEVIPQFAQAMRGMTAEVLGHVMEGGDIAHIVYRGSVALEGATIKKVAVISMKGTDQGWGMLLTGDIENMARMLELQMGGD
jgi:hypothetical protein